MAKFLRLGIATNGSHRTYVIWQRRSDVRSDSMARSANSKIMSRALLVPRVWRSHSTVWIKTHTPLFSAGERCMQTAQKKWLQGTVLPWYLVGRCLKWACHHGHACRFSRSIDCLLLEGIFASVTVSKASMSSLHRLDGDTTHSLPRWSIGSLPPWFQ